MDHTDRQADRKTDIQTDVHTYIHIYPPTYVRTYLRIYVSTYLDGEEEEEVCLFYPKYNNSVMLHRFWFKQVGIITISVVTFMLMTHRFTHHFHNQMHNSLFRL